MNPDAPLLSFKQVTSSPLRPIVWDVKPLFARGDRVVLYGDFGSLKSWILLDLGMHLAVGEPWVGLAVPEPRRVLYIDEEMPRSVLDRRVWRLAEGRGWRQRDLPFRMFSHSGFRFGLYGAGALMARLKAEKFVPEVVVIETLTMTLDGDENSNSAITQMWRRAQELVDAGMSVVISHHMNKPSGDPKSVRLLRHRARGGTNILAGCDIGYAVEQQPRNPQASHLRAVKSREAKVDPKGITLELVDLGEGEECPVRLQRYSPSPQTCPPPPGPGPLPPAV